MPEIPGFFQQFEGVRFKQPPTNPIGYAVVSPQPVLAEYSESKLDKPSSERTRSFTLKDWEFVAHIATAGSSATNGELAKHFGIGRPAASSRIKRLVEMGLLSVEYEHADETGKVNRRTICVVELPERPWSPE